MHGVKKKNRSIYLFSMNIKKHEIGVKVEYLYFGKLNRYQVKYA